MNTSRKLKVLLREIDKYRATYIADIRKSTVVTESVAHGTEIIVTHLFNCFGILPIIDCYVYRSMLSAVYHNYALNGQFLIANKIEYLQVTADDYRVMLDMVVAGIGRVYTECGKAGDENMPDRVVGELSIMESRRGNATYSQS